MQTEEKQKQQQQPSKQVLPAISSSVASYNPMPRLWHPSMYGRSLLGSCDAVIDIEALVMRNFVLVEQIGLVMLDYRKRELYAKKFYVEQPLNERELAVRFGISTSELRRAIEGYERVTGDSFIHPKTHATHTWRETCAMLNSLFQQYCPVIWAKGASLERRVFGSVYIINELADFGCPRYPPGKTHDPLAECYFFSQFIPERDVR